MARDSGTTAQRVGLSLEVIATAAVGRVVAGQTHGVGSALKAFARILTEEDTARIRQTDCVWRAVLIAVRTRVGMSTAADVLVIWVSDIIGRTFASVGAMRVNTLS